MRAPDGEPLSATDWLLLVTLGPPIWLVVWFAESLEATIAGWDEHLAEDLLMQWQGDDSEEEAQ